MKQNETKWYLSGTRVAEYLQLEADSNLKNDTTTSELIYVS